ncbi:MAG: hypothetical protein ABI467_05675 [Kofleriaceae bacterium]
MRVPASAVVMTLVVAVPFGFAIRDTLEGNDAQSQQDRAAAEVRAEQDRFHAQELARQQAEYEHENQRTADRQAMFASLIGSTPGTLGARFGAQVGEPAPADFDANLSAIDHVEDRLEDGANHGLQLHGDGAIASVSFTIGDAHCAELRTIVDRAWGPSHDDIWLDTAHHRRASLGGLLCVLHFDEYADDPMWAKAVMPALIGKTPAEAQRLLGKPTVPLDEPSLSWYLPGPAAGRNSTELRAEVTDGRIRSLIATTNVSTDAAGRLLDAMAKRLGGPWGGREGVYEWPKHQVAVTYSDSLFTVISGAAADEP